MDSFSSTIPWSQRSLLTQGKKVAVTPFPPKPKSEVRGGVVAPMNAANLVALTVEVDGDHGIPAGHRVYVRSRLAYTSTYADEVFELYNRKFILIPLEEVLVIEGSSK